MPELQEVKIAVLDERMRSLSDKVDYLTKSINRIEDKLDESFVKRDEHERISVKVNTLWEWRFKVLAYAFLGGVIGSIILRIIPLEDIFR